MKRKVLVFIVAAMAALNGCATESVQTTTAATTTEAVSEVSEVVEDNEPEETSQEVTPIENPTLSETAKKAVEESTAAMQETKSASTWDESKYYPLAWYQDMDDRVGTRFNPGMYTFPETGLQANQICIRGHVIELPTTIEYLQELFPNYIREDDGDKIYLHDPDDDYGYFYIIFCNFTDGVRASVKTEGQYLYASIVSYDEEIYPENLGYVPQGYTMGDGMPEGYENIDSAFSTDAYFAHNFGFAEDVAVCRWEHIDGDHLTASLMGGKLGVVDLIGLEYNTIKEWGGYSQ